MKLENYAAATGMKKIDTLITLHQRMQLHSEAVSKMRQTDTCLRKAVFRWGTEDHPVVSKDVPAWRDLYDLWELRTDCENLEPEG